MTVSINKTLTVREFPYVRKKENEYLEEEKQ